MKDLAEFFGCFSVDVTGAAFHIGDFLSVEFSQFPAQFYLGKSGVLAVDFHYFPWCCSAADFFKPFRIDDIYHFFQVIFYLNRHLIILQLIYILKK
jgi:hypothetical protein